MNIFDQFRLDDRVAVVTGGAQGLGLAMGEALLSAGAHLAIVDIDGDKAAATAERLSSEYGGRARAYRVDLTDEAAVVALTERLIGQYGRIDILFNNAGIAHHAPSESDDYDDWKRVIDIDLNAVYLLSREIGRHMLAEGGGSIVNTSSMSGLIANVPQPQSAYNAAKSGVNMLTKSLAAEWGDRGVRVNAIAPGYMKTEITRAFFEQGGPMIDRWLSMTPMGRAGEPRELGGLALYLASDASSFVTGAVFSVDGGYTAI
ncbi:SDR family NAD(P)-dependent oxidoreductase [Salinisphaera sp. Q1T1-3]|uniref:SDR family NAD(P)-dependent oxidoreductase n=1 Tax=Salinisphaera sp. Q1T1-3 TaxID=2321229 RepID=UPI0018F503B8|nr:glucose 1-dehydrogenase [Salinisphaera sp. Q1T1-3]